MAALVLQLREEGRLWLGDAPLHAGCPTIRAPSASRSKMLLDHRSGIFDYFAHPGYESRVFGRPHHRWTPSQILALRGPRYCEPGACFHYSNTNYVLLGQVVRKVTGRRRRPSSASASWSRWASTTRSSRDRSPSRKVAAKGYWAIGRRLRGLQRRHTLPPQHVRRHGGRSGRRHALLGARHLRLAGRPAQRRRPASRPRWSS